MSARSTMSPQTCPALQRPLINAFYPITLSVCAALGHVAVGLPVVLLGIGLLWLNAALHELGHIVFARKAGHFVGKVLVLPGYGRTNVQSQGHRGRVTMIVAGPLAGAVGAAAGLLALRFSAGTLPGLPDARPLVWLGWAILADNLLNLVPYGVLDGQRALGAYRQRKWLDLLQPRSVSVAAETEMEPVKAETMDEGEQFVAEARDELAHLLSCATSGAVEFEAEGAGIIAATGRWQWEPAVDGDKSWTS